MKRPRFTIAEIALFVLVVALGLAAIRSGSTAWTGAIVSVTYFALFCSLLGVAFGRRGRRVYWVGFAVLGWGYLSLFYLPWQGASVGDGLFGPNLFEYVGDIVHPDPAAPGGLQNVSPAVLGVGSVGGGFGGGPAAGFTNGDVRARVVRIGIALEALLWAFLGGWVARYFASGTDGAFAQQEVDTGQLASTAAEATPSS
jgi:hypothetical protein